MIELTANQSNMLDRIPEFGENAIESSELCWRLCDFATLHSLERKGLIEVEYNPGDEAYVTRSLHDCVEPYSCDDPRCWP